MRILHFVDRLTDRGGAYTQLLGILAEQAHEHDVRLAFGRDEGHVPAPCPATRVTGLDARTRRSVNVAPLVRDVRPEVVHLHNVVNPDALERVGRLDGVEKVITVQDHRFFCPGRGKWTSEGDVCAEAMTAELCTKCFADDAYYREILELTEARLRVLSSFRVVVLSHYMKRELDALGVRDIAVIPPFVHGLDPEARADGPPCVLFVGRLVEPKGVFEVVEAWKRSTLDLPLVIAGTGTLREKIAGCEVLGWVPREKMSALYRRAAAVLMASRWQEPFGIVGLEALAMGVPVATWESGGIREWHPGAGLVRWGDVDGLARALRTAVGRRVTRPVGFDREDLMSRLADVYSGRRSFAGTLRGPFPL